jgi:hypothetical protein
MTSKLPPAGHARAHDLRKEVGTMRKRLAIPRLALLLAAVTAALAAPGLAEARITRIEITGIESPTFAGSSFGRVGQYEKLVGRA